MPTFIKFSITIVLLLIVGGTSYMMGSSSGFSSGFDVGVEQTKATKPAELTMSTPPPQVDLQPLIKENEDLRNKYNDLVNDYNSLQTSAAARRAPVTCSSYSFGMNSTSTTCY